MPPSYFPLRWETTGAQWWFASPIDWAAANGHYDVVRELLHLDTNLLIKLTSLRRIRRLESVWDDEEQFNDVAKCRSEVAKKLLLECGGTKKGRRYNSLIRAGYGGWLLYTAASAGDVGFVKELLDMDPLLVYGEGEYGVTDILYASARSKNSEVFRILLDCSLQKRDSGNRGNGGEEEASSVFRWDMINRAVHAAARGGNVEMLRELLGDCKDVLVYRDALGSTLLHTASGGGQAEVVGSLLAYFDIVDSTDNQGNTALNIAAYKGHLAVVEVLMSASPSSMSVKNNYGDTFLHMAVAGFKSPGFRRMDRQMELMRKLVSGEIANIEDIINARNNDGRTALHIAVMENIHSDLLELLMSAPYINLNVRDSGGKTPLYLLKQRPKSPSSEILIWQMIAAGGISNCRDHRTRSALVSHLKMQGIGGSPGTSFKIPDAEIFLYTGIENAYDPGRDFESTDDYDPRSGEVSYCGSPAGSDSYKTKFRSVNGAAQRLRILLHLPKRKEGKMQNASDLEESHSVESCRFSSQEIKPISLRQRFTNMASNKRVVALPGSLPSPSTKKKFAAGLMHGVLQVKRHSSFAATQSPLSGSSWSSPLSNDGEKELGRGNGNENATHSGFYRSPKTDETKMMKRNEKSFHKKAMDQYLCFGAQGGALVDDTISSVAQSQSCEDSVH